MTMPAFFPPPGFGLEPTPTQPIDPSRTIIVDATHGFREAAAAARPGDVVIVRAEPPVPSTGRHAFDATGSPGNPVWLMTAIGVRVNGAIRFGDFQTASHINAVGLDARTIQIVGKGSHHIALRDCDLTGGAGLFLASWDNSLLHHILIDGGNVHENGDWTSTAEADTHGVTGNGHVEDVWILNHRSGHNGGDGVQLNSRGGYVPTRWFIDLISVAEGENGVDLKGCRDVVVTGYVGGIDGHKASDPGWGIVGHKAGADAPNNVWIVDATVDDSNIGIGITGGKGYTIAGCRISNIHGGGADGLDGAGLGVRAVAGVRLVGNTFLACKTATLAQSGGSFVQLGQAQAQAEYLAAFGVELPESVFGGEPPVVPPEPDPIDPEPSGEIGRAHV